ncbi:MAG: carboxypeptidase regulatory-like domain-containing protein [Acidobacteriaceae bacterium]|nr:carboxypeptidase regulatory-like domain-containing protein [Acidobacteriaceae bacterium]
MSGRAKVEVVSDNVDGVVLTLQKMAPLNGKIVVEGGGEISLGMIGVYLTAKEPGVGAPGSARSAADGTFQLQVWPEHYDVHLQGLAGNTYIKSIHFGEADVTATGLDLSQGVPPGDLTVRISKAGGQVDGSVVDGQEQPVPGAMVVLVPGTERRSNADLYKVTKTDAAGKFTLHGIAPGEYELLAWDEVEFGAWQDPDFLKQYEARAEKVTVQEDSRENKRLTVIAANVSSPAGK